MAVTLTPLELAAAIRVGDGVTELEEPQAGIVNRLLGVGAELVQAYAPRAPVVVQNEATIRIAGYMYDSPLSGPGAAYAAALVNSGAAALLTAWRTRRVLWLDDFEPTRADTDGLAQVGEVTLTLPAMLWTDTGIPIPTKEVIGVDLVLPDGSRTGIDLMTNILPTDEPVSVGTPADPELLESWALGRTTRRTVAIAVRFGGVFQVTIWESD